MTIPDRMYRAFKEKEFADAFMEGKIWLGRMDGYKAHEDPVRRDPREGSSEVYVPGEKLIVEYEGNEVTEVRTEPGIEHMGADGDEEQSFLLCCSAPSDGTIQPVPRLGLGVHQVAIEEPEQFIHDLETQAKRQYPHVEVSHARVSYSRGQTVPPEFDDPDLGWSQKESSFGQEQEYRVRLWTPTPIDKPGIIIELPNPPVASYVHRPVPGFAM